jgi:hypothetical protein
MRVEPIRGPLRGEFVAGAHPPLIPFLETDDWRRRLHLYTGRALSHTALTLEQRGRGGRLAVRGQMVSPGVVFGLEADVETETAGGAPRQLFQLAPGFGIAATGEDVVLTQPMRVAVRDVPVYATPAVLGERSTPETDGDPLPAEAPRVAPYARTLGKSLGELIDARAPLPPAGILVLQPIVANLLGKPVPKDPTEPDPQSDAFDDWQWADGCRLVLYAWPTEWRRLPKPDARWRNRIAYAIFDRESAGGASSVLPWEELGVPVSLIGFGEDWSVAFVDAHAVVRAGGKPKQRTSCLPNVGHPFFWQARMQQFAEQVAETDPATTPPRDLEAIFRFLPPAGLLPKEVMDPRSGRNYFFPGYYGVDAVPVPIEQLDAVLEACAPLAPFDLFMPDRARLLVPVPQAWYEPRLLLTEEVSPEFQRKLDAFIERRTELLCRREDVRRKAEAITDAITGGRPLFPHPDADPDRIEKETPKESPAPFSGRRAHQSNLAPAAHQHYFTDATDALPVQAGDVLVAYVYLDPLNPPEEVMLQWNDGSWDHRAYWGADRISWGSNGTASRRRMGALPATGRWVRLEAPAADVGLVHRTVTGMAFTLFGGRATWDHAGKAAPGAAGPDGDLVWFGDALPAGAKPAGDEPWVWVDSTTAELRPLSGSRVHLSNAMPGLHQHYFTDATSPIRIFSGDRLFVYVYLDPLNPPSELMLQWREGNSWEHRACWGSDQIPWGKAGTSSRRAMGSLPPPGRWVRLEVPASAVGLEGRNVSGMAFTLFDGRAAWERAGRSPAATPGPASDVVWVEDALPPGARPNAVGSGTTPIRYENESWCWINVPPDPAVSGEDAYRTDLRNKMRVSLVLERLAEDLRAGPLKPAERAELFRLGLEPFVAWLEEKIRRADDRIDLGFMRVQTEIYRIRQLTLDNAAATRLATSPALASIAKGESAAATREDIQKFFDAKKGAVTAVPMSVMSQPGGTERALATGPAAGFPAGISQPGGATNAVNIAPADGAGKPGVAFAGSAGLPIGSFPIESAAKSIAKAGALSFLMPSNLPAELVQAQAALPGSTYNFRTMSLAERIEQPKSPEAKASAVATRHDVLVGLAALDLAIDDIRIPGIPKLVSGVPVYVEVNGKKIRPERVSLPFGQLMSMVRKTGGIKDILIEPDPPDADESMLYAIAVELLDHTIAALRAVEGRLAAYKQVLAACRNALGELKGTAIAAARRLQDLAGDLAEARHDVATARALLAEEESRVKAVNARRDEIVDKHVPFVAFCRPRSAELVLDTPARDLDPGQADDAVPDAIAAHVEGPAELRAYLNLLREAPVSWFVQAPKLLDRLDRLDVLHGALLGAKDRAKVKSLPAPARVQTDGAVQPIGLAIAQAISAKHQMVTRLRARTAELDLDALAGRSWKEARDQARDVLSFGDLLDADHGRPEVARLAGEALESIYHVAASLWVRFGEVLPALRLQWAERLSQFDAPVSLRRLQDLPRWGELDNLLRAEMQHLADWLYLRVDPRQPEAVGLIDDLVRVCLLLASHSPVNQILAGHVNRPVTVGVGGRVSLAIDPARVRVGMLVQLYAGVSPVARGVIEDLGAGQAEVRVLEAKEPTVALAQGARAELLDPKALVASVWR